MADSIKTKTVHGVIWSALERFSLQGVQFLINIVMARLLLPSDYGLIAMLAIFLQISQAFVDSGFTNALIQRKDRNEVDFSTVFYFNIVIAVVFYGCSLDSRFLSYAGFGGGDTGDCTESDHFGFVGCP